MNHDQFRLDGKNVIITGASSGIGRQCAIECSNRGSNVTLMSRDSMRLKETLGLMKEGNHLIVPVDITSEGDLHDALVLVLDRFNQIHGFIHSAGIQLTMAFRQMKIDNYRKLFEVNLYPALEIAKLVTNPRHIPPEGSSIVFISSISGIKGRAGVTGYASTKGALISAVRSMAIELAKKKVRVNCVSPGLIMTDIVRDVLAQLNSEQLAQRTGEFLLGLGEPQDVANACVYLMADASRWITGTNLIVDGGLNAH